MITILTLSPPSVRFSHGTPQHADDSFPREDVGDVPFLSLFCPLTGHLKGVECSPNPWIGDLEAMTTQELQLSFNLWIQIEDWYPDSTQGLTGSDDIIIHGLGNLRFAN